MKTNVDKIQQAGSIIPDVDCEPKTISHECRNTEISNSQNTAKIEENNKNEEI